MKAGTVRVTIVVDNQAGPGLMAEHGLALLVQTAGQCVLFDTGQGEALAVNMNAMGLDPGAVDQVVLSHGHYDHSGGLPWVLGNAHAVGLYCHPGVTQPRYSLRNGGLASIQMPHNAMAALDKVDEQHMHWVLEPVQLGGDVHLTGPVPRQTDYEDVGGSFYLDPEGRRPDPIDDDMALWVSTATGVVVCVGCCHAGLVNTLNLIREQSGGAPIAAVIGGFHLLNAGPDRINATLAELKAFAPGIVVPCHCTGSLAMMRLQQELGESLALGVSGRSYLF